LTGSRAWGQSDTAPRRPTRSRSSLKSAPTLRRHVPSAGAKVPRKGPAVRLAPQMRPSAASRRRAGRGRPVVSRAPASARRPHCDEEASKAMRAEEQRQQPGEEGQRRQWRRRRRETVSTRTGSLFHYGVKDQLIFSNASEIKRSASLSPPPRPHSSPRCRRPRSCATALPRGCCSRSSRGPVSPTTRRPSRCPPVVA